MMKKFFHLLFAVTSGCGKLPLWGALALLGAARLAAVLEPGTYEGVVETKVERPKDAELIERVLEKRAPELGLELRNQVGQAIAEEAHKAGYDPLLALAIIDVESDFIEDAVSQKGAKGLMQIRPSTLYFLAQREGLKLRREEVAADPALQVRLGIRYLRDLNDRFGDLDMALMAYNAGPARLRQAVRERDLDTFRGYPRLVRRDFRRFREGQGLGGDWALALRQE